MHNFRAQSIIATTLATNFAFLSAAAAPIGVALVNGRITIDKVLASDNAPFYEGNTIETGRASSRLQLRNGIGLKLGSESRAKIYNNRLVLEKGATQFKTSKGYEVDALSVKVTGNAPNSSARISVRGASVEVAALYGSLRVANGRGLVLANLAPGKALNFTPQEAGATAAAALTGCLAKSGSNTFLLTDETSNVVAELRGSGLEEQVGHRIQVAGSISSGTPARGATEVIEVGNIKRLSGNCSLEPVAGAAGAAVVGVHTAIIAGVVIAAAVGTTVGVVATSGEQNQNEMSQSR